jgi:CBS domain-containing protein
MKIMQLLTPMTQVQWLPATDTVRDAFDHMETYELSAAPILDWSGRYLGTVTEADLRRHVESSTDRTAALATALSAIERRAQYVPVTIDRDVESVLEQASTHRFVPVVDDLGRLVGIVDRRRILGERLPSAA